MGKNKMNDNNNNDNDDDDDVMVVGDYKNNNDNRKKMHFLQQQQQQQGKKKKQKREQQEEEEEEEEVVAAPTEGVGTTTAQLCSHDGTGIVQYIRPIHFRQTTRSRNRGGGKSNTNVDNKTVTTTTTTTTGCKIVKVVREHYIRNDLGFGYYYTNTSCRSFGGGGGGGGVDMDDMDDENVEQQGRPPSAHNHSCTSNTMTVVRNDIDKVHGIATVIETVDELLSLLIVDDNNNNNNMNNNKNMKNNNSQKNNPFLSSSSSCCLSSSSSLIICDTNVLLHNLDVFERWVMIGSSNSSSRNNNATGTTSTTTTVGGMGMGINFVIPQTALIECRHHSVIAYDRTIDLLRSIESVDSNNNNNNNKTRFRRRRRRKCGIFFPDMHHIETATTANIGSSSSPNDINDARIRNVASFFGRTLYGTNIQVILLTDDISSRRIANHNNDNNSNQQQKKKSYNYYHACSVRTWIQQLEQQYPDLLLSYSLSDLVSAVHHNDHQHHDEDNNNNNKKTTRKRKQHPNDDDNSDNDDKEDDDDDDDDGVGGGNKNVIHSISPAPFPAHLDSTALSRGIQSGIYHRGILRTISTSTSIEDEQQQQQQEQELHHKQQQQQQQQEEHSIVTIRRGDEERVAVTIIGWLNRNRALDGDIVAIALNPLQQWIRTTTTTTSNNTTTTGEMPTTTIPTPPSQLNNNNNNNVVIPPDSIITVDTVAKTMKPTGKVVGIIRRKFDYHSGSIYMKKNGASCSSSSSSTPRIKKKMNAAQQQQQQQDDVREVITKKYEREHDDGRGTTTCVFFPVTYPKVPPILIRTTQRERLLGQRIIVAMDSWPITSLYPLGHYVRTIGPIGSKSVETDVLLHQHDIPYEPFPAAVLACLPPENYTIKANDDNDNDDAGVRRRDLRHIPVLSIDPPNCKDIDDALHCTVLSNGNYQIGVHIADVTHYVKPGTAIDIEAARRSTSTYLVDRRLDMLPSLLTTNLCSLKSNVDRYAFSVLWEVNPNTGDIIHVEFTKSIIHSTGALTYQQAQNFIDDQQQQQQQPKDSIHNNNYNNNNIQACSVQRLAQMARIFRKRRMDAGALTLASPEVKFVIDNNNNDSSSSSSESVDNNQNPTDIQSYTLLESNALVEEFMLLANVTVAKKILRQYPTLSVLRRHPAPNRAMFDSLISKAHSIGIDINIDDSKQLADSLDKAATITKSDPYVNKLLRILSTRCMSPAQYFCSGEYRPMDWHHYGLAAPVYTHFTSPIRRYADICVHRLLASSIGIAPLPQHLSSKSYLHDLCTNMNRRHRSAQLAGRDSVQLHTLIYFSSNEYKNSSEKNHIEDAYVLDVDTTSSSLKQPSFTVIVPRYGIEGRVIIPIPPPSSPPHTVDDNNDCDPRRRRLQRYPEEHRISYRIGNDYDNNVVSIKVFDKVKVRIWVQDDVQDQQQQQRELVLDLVEPKFTQ